MNRPVRNALVAMAALIFVAAVGIGIFLAAMDPNEFKPRIEAATLAATGKELSLQGDLSFSIFPSLRLEAGPAELKNSPGFGTEPFARIEKLSASVRILPLFSGKAEVGSVTLSGLRLNLVVNEAGKANWVMRRAADTEKDTQKKTEQDAPTPAVVTREGAGSVQLSALPALSLESLEITDSLIAYQDKRSGHTTHVALSSLALRNLKTGEKTSLAFKAAYTGPMIQPATLALNADFTLPHSLAEDLLFTAKGTLGKAPLALEGVFSLPETPAGQGLSLRGSLAIGDLNLDQYLNTGDGQVTRASAPSSGGKTGSPAASSVTAKQTDNDETLRETLRSLLIDLRVSIKSLTVHNISFTDIQTVIKADQGVLTAGPVTMTAAEAPLTLNLSADARGDALQSRVSGEWQGAKLGPLLRAAKGITSFSGILNGSWDVSATGSQWPQAAQTLEGSADASLTNGRLPGFTLIPAGVPGLPAQTLDLTELHATGTWNIAKGIARNNNLSVRAAGLAATGNGTVNIPAQRLHYAISVQLPTLPALPNLTVLPVVISGPLNAPSYAIDQPALLREATRSIFTAPSRAGSTINRAGERLGNLLSR